jgi:uncharacterized membrane protein HdeD (DUF308 family)
VTDAGTSLIAAGALAIVAGVAVLARLRGRRRWPQLLVGAGAILLLAGLLVRSSAPHPEPCATDDPHVCAIDSGNGP